MAKTKIPTLQDAMMTHYKRYKNGQESAEQYLRLLKQCIAILGNKKISQITSKDVTPAFVTVLNVFAILSPLSA